MKRSIRASGKSRAENWGLRSPFFCLSKGQRHLKTKTDTAGDGICRHLFFYTNFRDGCRRRQKMNLEAQKRAPIYEALERFWKKRVVPVVAANRVGEERLMEDRLSWGLFRDRRPEMYGKICSAVWIIKETPIIAKRKRMQYNKTVRKNGIRRA